MAKKRTSLLDVLGDGVGNTQEAMPAEESAPKLSGSPEVAVTAEKPKGSRTPDKKQHTVYLSIPVHQQLRRLAFDEERKIHDLVLEGIDRVFAERGLPSIAELIDKDR